MEEHSFEQWKQIWTQQFPEPKSVEFSAPTMTNDYCAECRFCCGPQPESEPFPMALLDSQISERTAGDFWLLDAHTACLDRRGCRALRPDGCALPRHLRPVACGLFPVVLVNDRLYLYKVCPASLFVPEEKMMAMAKEIQTWLNTLPAADIARLAIYRRPEDLQEKYTDLSLPVTGRP